ncbi:unnamed protein product [Linum trigynum]|uniref:glucan endo-1,3-beta-D-glucosidase n=1 Tax=Linum trigynum TaxID=586398 RepID=A0AAV2GHU4_9ROSI
MGSSKVLHSPKNSHFTNVSTALLLLAPLLASLHTTVAQIGVCYGRVGSNLPQPGEVVALFNQNNIRRMRLYDPHQPALDALRGTDIELMLDVPNDQLRSVASSQGAADAWVRDNVVGYAAAGVRFRYITVGNEVDPADGRFAPFLFGAIQNIQTALNDVGLGDRVKASTAFKFDVMGNAFPPSDGSFNQQYRSLLDSILPFLRNNNSPMMLNLYPFFSYRDNPGNNPGQIRLDYATFTGPPGLVSDPPLSYSNLFDAMLDATYSALEKKEMGSLNIVVSETGWSSAGGGDATTVDNARAYNYNLVQHVKVGTPKRTGPIETYIFAMFDEGDKEPELEKHFGLFSPDRQPKYPMNFN